VLIVLLVLLVAAGVALVFPWLPVQALQRIWPRIVWVTSSRPIAITFDDGPDATYTPEVLAILNQHQVRATFFLAGDQARRHPNIVKQICDAGHEIANHSDSWKRTFGLRAGEFEQDVLRADETLRAFPCFRRFFRPAGVMIHGWQVGALERMNYVTVLGSGYGFDPQHAPESVIVWTIGRSLRPGAIVVLHDAGGNREATVRALPRIIERARQNRLEMVPLSTLLQQSSR
jgi:peptidoglycan-N-acetylglucosamine deacetylase